MTLYYDSNCSLCHSAVRFILKTDKKGVFHFLPLSQLPEISQQKLPDSLVLKINGEYFTDGTAVLKIMNQLGGSWKIIGKSLGVFPISVLDFIYRIVAQYRKRWKLVDKNVCPLVSRELKRKMGLFHR
jgi:predicted DCC family thiol-disulfide oxidoreductase YuxK